MRSRSPGSGTWSATVCAIRARVVAGSSDSSRPARERIISPSAQNVTPSPYEGRASLVPQHALDDAVDVLEELPREAALADARLPGDRDEPDPPLARAGVEQVLEQPELRVAPDERRLEPVVAAATPALGDDPDRPPCGHRGDLAFEQVLAGLLVGDRPGCGEVGRLADQDGARRGDPPGAGLPC